LTSAKSHKKIPFTETTSGKRNWGVTVRKLSRPAEWAEFLFNQAQQQTTEIKPIGLDSGKAQWVHDDILPISSDPKSVKYRVSDDYGVHPTI